MKNAKKTAATEYSEKAAISRDLLNESPHAFRPPDQTAANPNDWGYVGDLGRVNEELAQVLAALGDRSGVDELGLQI